MYIHELYPTHMWHKNLESILAASGSLALEFLRENVLQIKPVWRKHPWSKRPRAGHLHCTVWLYNEGGRPWAAKIRRLFDDARAQQPKQRAGKPQCGFPALCFTGFAHASGEEASQGRTTSPDQLQWLEQNLCLQWFCSPQVERGWSFQAPWKYKRRQSPWTESWNQTLMRRWSMIFFREFNIMKACQHPNISTVFSAYEVPFPAFIMELLGKTKDRSLIGPTFCPATP